MTISIAGIALTQLGLPKVDMLILHNFLSEGLISWFKKKHLTSEMICSVLIYHCQVGLKRFLEQL